MPECRCTCPPTAAPFDTVIATDCPIHGHDATTLIVGAIDRGLLIAAQPAGRCELCGLVEETRPYGPHGEEVCLSCGMQDEDAMRRGFARRLQQGTE